MKHYEERLEQDLRTIRAEVVELGEMVQTAAGRAVRAMLDRDAAVASRVIIDDHPINRKTREIDRRCHAFVARHLPTAGHLRFVSAVLRLTLGIERVGDYAVTIARESVQLDAPTPEPVARDIEMMSDQTMRMLKQALESFHDSNADLARGTMAMAKQVDATFEKVFTDLTTEGEHDDTPVRDLFALLVVFNRLERISDQAKNICEETVFAVTGEMKAPKTYRILFVDEKNDCTSQMAAAIAARAFPESGRYASAGWSPAETLDEAYVSFMSERGDLTGTAPTKLDPSRHVLDDFHVIVGLEPGARSRIPALPFHTVLLEWDLSEAAAEGLEATYKALSLEIRDLMETLRGEGAA